MRLPIQDTALPMTPASAIEDLKTPISSTYFLFVITGLKNGKRTGPDGYTPRFYKTFEKVDEAHPLSSQLLQDQILFIPKPGKDRASC